MSVVHQSPIHPPPRPLRLSRPRRMEGLPAGVLSPPSLFWSSAGSWRTPVRIDTGGPRALQRGLNLGVLGIWGFTEEEALGEVGTEW